MEGIGIEETVQRLVIGAPMKELKRKATPPYDSYSYDPMKLQLSVLIDQYKNFLK